MLNKTDENSRLWQGQKDKQRVAVKAVTLAARWVCADPFW